MPQQIVALSGPLVGRVFALADSPLSFGRTPENSIVIASPLASRRHAEIRREGDGYVLYDLGSSNGTLVNGQRMQSQRLQPGDVISIGDETFRFDAPAIDKTLLAAPPVSVPTAAAQGPAPLPPNVGSPAQSPLPPLPNYVPAGGPATPQRSSRLPILIALGVLVACVLLGGLAGGVFLFTRVRNGIPPVSQQTAQPGLAATSGPAPTREAVAGGADWTVMVYLDGDNNLEADALNDFLEMAEIGSSEKLKIVVELDRISSSESWDDTSAGDWNETKRFFVEQSMRPDAEAAVEDLGERNMGDPAELAEFIEWGVTNYPAQRYALIIWDHGASWLGIASDDSDSDGLNLPELSSALQTATEHTGVGKLDLIGFDACLMAQIDVLAAVAPYGQVAVASAELEPNQGWAWNAWLGALADDTTQDARAIAPVIVDTYMQSYEGSEADEVTLSAFDLERLDPLLTQVDELSGAMVTDMEGAYTAIGQARSFVGVYAPSYSEEFNAVDLGDFARLLPEQGATGNVATAAKNLGSALEDARLANGAGSYHRNGSGLSIYFPQLEELYTDNYEQGSPLPRQTRWADFLKGYYGAGTSAVQRPTISDLSIDSQTVSVNASVNLTGTVSGADIAYVFSFIGIPNASRDTVDLIYVDYVYPPGATPNGSVPNWEAGQHNLRLGWDATNWYLSNGQDQIEVLLGPVKYGTSFYGVEGVYTSKATGEEIDAGLIFNVNQGRGELMRIWGFPKSAGKQEPQPFELEPASGDTFTAYIRTYTDTGSSLDPGRVKGQTITFGDQPLRASFGSTLSGDYVMGFLVRDIAGNFSYDYVDVTVDNSGANNQPQPGATTGQGSQSGFLAFNSPALGFSVEHPDTWEAYDTGRDKIVFYNPSAQDEVYFSVDIYSLNKGSGQEANSEILRQLIELTSQTVEGQVRVKEEDFNAAGLAGRKVEYVYRNQEGGLSYVTAFAVTSPTSERTYLVTAEAPEEIFDAQVDTFNAMLETFKVE